MIDTDVLHLDTVRGVTFVNQYALAGVLGRGAQGAVQAALDVAGGGLVALKILPRMGKGDRADALAARRRGVAGPPGA